jgi:hypothetical protein
LVAEAFIPNPENKETVNHKNIFNLSAYENKRCNVVENLEWATQKENNEHAFDIGLKKSGEEHHYAKLTDEQVMYIRNNYKPHSNEYGREALVNRFGVSKQYITDISKGRTRGDGCKI